jgi:protein associated with RNAse G/E
MEIESSAEVAAPATGEIVTVYARKFDGRLHREWQARLLARSDSLVVVEGVFEAEIRHPQLGLIAPGTLSTEYYWTERWYSVFRFREPAGELRNYYCNINLPAEFDGRSLTFVDLDIDVLVAPDFSRRILDEDEFEANAARYAYPAEVRAAVPRALAELLALVERREYPFDWNR